LPCLVQEEASKPTPLAAPISTMLMISRTPMILTALKTSITIPIPTPAFKKKSSIWLIILLNSLKIVLILKPTL
jgi:hypothetical protein